MVFYFWFRLFYYCLLAETGLSDVRVKKVPFEPGEFRSEDG